MEVVVCRVGVVVLFLVVFVLRVFFFENLKVLGRRFYFINFFVVVLIRVSLKWVERRNFVVLVKVNI